MPSQQKAKTSKGARNDHRRSGKAWKAGKSPEVRLAEAKKAAEAKRARKSTRAVIKLEGSVSE